MIEIPYAPFCRKQARYIRECQTHWLNVAEGGKRAGKNIINILAWAICLETHPDKLHLAAGVTLAAAKMNILDSNGFGLRFLFDGRCRVGKYMEKEALYITTATGEKVVIFAGGGKISDAALIKGNSYGTAYITEVNECHQDFFQEVLSRTLASRDRRIFLDLNPKPPRHWFYAQYLDYQDELKAKGENPGYHYEHFTIADNLSIPDDQLKAALNTYDRGSVYYAVDIRGQRAASSGRIYTKYRYQDVAITPDEIRKMQFIELTVGVDVGGTDATAATLTGITQRYEKVALIDGMYHKQGISDKMDEEMYCKMIVEWLIPWTKIYPNIGTIYVDSAAKLFRAGLDRALLRKGLNRFLVRGFDKADGIMERIRLNCMLMNQGRFFISTAMPKWHEAYQSAVWSTDEYEKGEWVRLDDGSYPVDCLDSAEYSLYPSARYFIA